MCRYLVGDDRPAVYLKRLLATQADPALIRQLMFIYTVCQHPILRDFLGLVYCPIITTGRGCSAGRMPGRLSGRRRPMGGLRPSGRTPCRRG